MTPILPLASFVAHLSSRLDLAFESAELDLAAMGLDSFHLMELVAAIDDLGVLLDEDVFCEASSLRDLYGAYLRAAVPAQMREAQPT
jgi:hypothetical protein